MSNRHWWSHDSNAASLSKMGYGDKDFKSWRFASILVLFEIFLILCYAFATDYSNSANPGLAGSSTNSTDPSTAGSSDGGFAIYYEMYLGVAVMVFIGFGFLMTFLHTYSWSAVGYNFLMSALAVQWTIIVQGFFRCAYTGNWGSINLDIFSLITGNFGAAALMISFGAVLGKTSATQLIVMTIFEMAFYSMSEGAVTHQLHAIDMGGSMVIHAFGAFFGLAVSWMIGNPAEGKASPAYTKWSSTLAMVGTIFLWIYWPSFNAAVATLPGAQYRVVINTVLSISASCVAAFYTSRLFRPGKKFDFEELQNATLAGGVAVGSSADLVIRPWGALVVGNVAGLLSALGFIFLPPVMARLKIHDTCGVLYLHGMPGILGGIAGAISAATASASSYGVQYTQVFHAAIPVSEGGLGWSPNTQGAYQFAGLLTAIAFGIGGGLITGFVIRQPFFDPLQKDFYQDISEWSVHADKEQIGVTEHDLEDVDHHKPAAAVAAAADVPTKSVELVATSNPALAITHSTAAPLSAEITALVKAEVARVLAASSSASSSNATANATATAGTGSPVLTSIAVSPSVPTAAPLSA